MVPLFVFFGGAVIMVPLTNRERRAVMTVAFVVLLSAVVQWIRPHETKTRQFDYTLQDSLFKVLSADTARPELLPKTKSLSKKTSAQKTKRKKTRKKLPELQSIDPNTATASQLERLPHIGPKTAQAIIRYRQEHGPFKSIEELDNVKRIGPKTIERIRPFLILHQKTSKSDSAQSTQLP